MTVPASVTDPDLGAIRNDVTALLRARNSVTDPDLGAIRNAERARRQVRE